MRHFRFEQSDYDTGMSEGSCEIQASNFLQTNLNFQSTENSLLFSEDCK